MSTNIEINLKNVRSDNKTINKQSRKILDIRSDVSSIKSGIDSRVLARKGIASNLSKIVSQLQEVEKSVKKLHTFVDESMDTYEDAEKRVKALTDDFRGSKSLKDIIKSILDTVTTPIAIASSMIAVAKGLLENGMSGIKNMHNFVVNVKNKGEIIIRNMKMGERINSVLEKLKEVIPKTPVYKVVEYLGEKTVQLTQAAVDKAKVVYENTLTNARKVIDMTGRYLDAKKAEFLTYMDEKIIAPAIELKEKYLKSIDEFKRNAKEAIRKGVGKLDDLTQSVKNSIKDGIEYIKSFKISSFKDLLDKTFKAIPHIDRFLKARSNFIRSFYDENGNFNFSWNAVIDATKGTILDVLVSEIIEKVVIYAGITILGAFGIASAPVSIGVAIVAIAALNIPYKTKKEKAEGVKGKSVSDRATKAVQDTANVLLDKLAGIGGKDFVSAPA